MKYWQKNVFLSGISVAQYQRSLPSLCTVSKPRVFGFKDRHLVCCPSINCRGKKKSKLMEEFWSGTQLRTTGWYSSISQCEETAASLWGVKRQVRGCLIPVWKSRASVSRTVIFTRSVRYHSMTGRKKSKGGPNRH